MSIYYTSFESAKIKSVKMKRVIGLQLSNCKEAERIRKGNKNLSGQGGGEGGGEETKV